MSLSGRVALVTGASQGIGKACALKLAEHGATVALAARNEEKLKELVNHISGAGGKSAAFPMDVADEEQIKNTCKAVIAEFGKIDILVNNAGTTRDGLLVSMKEEDFDVIIQQNLKSVFNCSKAAVRQMITQRYGRIVNMTSMAGMIGIAGQTNYSAAKAGIIGFTKAMAKEYGARNIAVNAVAPGLVPTDLTASLPAAVTDGLIRLTAFGRAGTADEIAEAVVFLASDAASYITGQILAVDGGLT
jgi:3-oxoacyl-[acyl-carrier protein] reductase